MSSVTSSTNHTTIIKDKDNYIFQCPHPHCGMYIIVKEKDLNCKIFRHGVLKDSTMKQIDPHASKKTCDQLHDDKIIYGCGKPFRIHIENNQAISAYTCDYI